MGMPAHFQGILKLIVIAKIHFTQTGKKRRRKKRKMQASPNEKIKLQPPATTKCHLSLGCQQM